MDEMEMYLAIISIIVTILLAIFRWWWTHREKKEPTIIQQTNTQSQKVIVNVHPSPQPEIRVDPAITTNELKEQIQPEPLKKKEKETLINETFEVSGGDYQDISFELLGNEIIEGTLQDEYRQDFMYYLLDHRNFALFGNDEKFSTILDGEGEKIYIIKKKIKKPDTYHFIIHLYGKSNDRAINVKLTRRPA